MAELTQARLKELLGYDAETGVFTWKVSVNSRVPVGAVAGTLMVKGYIQIGVEGRPYLAHRLAWFYTYGVWPEADIDHIDRVRDNNAIENLRPVSNKQNHENAGMNRNNTSGFRGVCWRKDCQRWVAKITHHSKQINLGYFETPDDASAAYEAARAKLFTHHVAQPCS